MKKRSKKNNIHKRYDRYANALCHTNNLAVVHVWTDGNISHLIDAKNKHRILVSQALYDMMRCTRFMWTIQMSAFCIDQNGTKYIKSDVMETKQRYTQYDLAAYLGEMHDKLLDSVNQAHLLGPGWIASPLGREFTEKEADEIFDMFNPWEKVLNGDVQRFDRTLEKPKPDSESGSGRQVRISP